MAADHYLIYKVIVIGGATNKEKAGESDLILLLFYPASISTLAPWYLLLSASLRSFW